MDVTASGSARLATTTLQALRLKGNAQLRADVLHNVERKAPEMASGRRPVLITTAATSYEDQYAARKHRYAALMAARLLLFVLAAAAYPVSSWLAVGLLALSVPLPWIAVLIANDAPARKTEDTHRLAAPEPSRQLESRGHVVVDVPPEGRAA